MKHDAPREQVVMDLVALFSDAPDDLEFERRLTELEPTSVAERLEAARIANWIETPECDREIAR